VAKAPTAKRYAQALFSLAREKASAERWLEELRSARQALDVPTVGVYLGTPRVRTEAKLNVVNDLLTGREPLVANMVGLLVSRQSLSLLDAVIAEYNELLNESLGRARAEVTTAVRLSDDQQQRLRQSLGSALDNEVVLDTREDAGIIGGLLVRVGDQIIDGSVRSRLSAMRQRLERGALA
jgi:F-type H+-transporting ATPase subunit delta